MSNLGAVGAKRNHLAPARPVSAPAHAPFEQLWLALRLLRVIKRRALNSPRGSGRMGIGLVMALVGLLSAAEATGAVMLLQDGGLALLGALLLFWGAAKGPGGHRAQVSLRLEWFE